MDFMIRITKLLLTYTGIFRAQKIFSEKEREDISRVLWFLPIIFVIMLIILL